MASEADHISLANHNHDALMALMPAVDRFPDWVSTIAFYKAVHVVEAVYAIVLNKHSCSHHDREQVMKARKFAAIYKDYAHLLTASRVARYLENASGTKYKKFSDFLDGSRVKQLIGQRLVRLEQSALLFLSDDARRGLKLTDPKLL